MYFKKNCFYGIYGINLIWHGSQADPELIWHGKSFNYYDVENPLWLDYCDDIENKVTDLPFEFWVKKNAYLVREYLKNLMKCECFYGGAKQ